MILRASWMVPIASSFIKDGAVLVRGGVIEDFGPAAWLLGKYPTEKVRCFEGAALLPGLVNVHTHLELTVLQGLVEPTEFWPWLRELVRIKYQVLSPEDLYWSARLGAVECIKSGTTTIGEAMDTGASLDAMIEAGLRGVAYQEVFGKDPREANQAMESLEQKLAVWVKKLRDCPASASVSQPAAAGERIRLGISPHSPYIASPSLLRQSSEYARRNGFPVSIHAAESEAEQLFIKDGIGPIAEYYREQNVPWSATGVSAIRYLSHCGYLNHETQLVHCLQMEPEDFELLSRSGASVAHCPSSNLKLHPTVMNLSRMREVGIKVGLGSDSLASNNSLDLWKEMRLAQFQGQRILDDSKGKGKPSAKNVEDLLRMATLGGAESLGLQSMIGSIEKGKAADLIAVDLTHAGGFTNPTGELVFSARTEDVLFTMVGGQTLYENARAQSLDEETIRKKAAATRDRIKPA